MILCMVFCLSQPVDDTIASIVTFYPSYAICLNIDQRDSLSVDESCHLPQIGTSGVFQMY